MYVYSYAANLICPECHLTVHIEWEVIGNPLLKTRVLFCPLCGSKEIDDEPRTMYETAL